MIDQKLNCLLLACVFLLLSTVLAQSGEKEFSPLASDLPIAPDALGLEFDLTFDDVEYLSQSSLATLADFYRREMTERGWQENLDELDIDDDSIDLVFNHDDASVELNLYQRSDGEVTVSMDCEELDFTGTNDPAALKAAGISQPYSYLYLQKNIQLPEQFIDLEYERDRICFKTRMPLQECFDHYSTMIKQLGYRESRKPIIDDDRRYTEFKQGSAEISINIFTHDYGTRLLIGYESDRKEKRAAPLPEVSALASATSAPEEKNLPDTVRNPDEMKRAESTVQAVNVSDNRGEVTVTHGSKKYTFRHVAAFQTKYYGDEHTTVVFSDQPIPMNRMQQLIATEDDFSFGDLFEFDLPSYISISLNKYTSFSFSVPGVGIGRGIEEPETEMTIEGGRITASIKMPAEEIFDKPFSFVATAEAGLITPDTRLSNFADPPAEKSPEEKMGIAGVPLPEEAEDVYSEGTPFRKVTHATVNLIEPEVVMFYQEELSAQGWEEEPSTITPEATTLNFRQPGKKLAIALKFEGDNIKIEAALLDEAKAKSMGLLPEPGKGRLVMGNSHKQASRDFDWQTQLHLAAGQRALTIPKMPSTIPSAQAPTPSPSKSPANNRR